jgi:uncharacterized protein
VLAVHKILAGSLLMVWLVPSQNFAADRPTGMKETVKTNLMAKSPQSSNRLGREKSPYLLQHQHNPVDWYAWGPDAFEKARRENKPIFLSIGYSTCHWCHVMERESFEDAGVAEVLNQNFVSIKVDREERPDVDKIYMTFVQATTGQGGWPLNVFLTTDLKPFYGGTYFPPAGAHGRPGFRQLLQQITEVWRSKHGELSESATEIQTRLQQVSLTNSGTSGAELSAQILGHAGKALKENFDTRNGGFGGAPKFPQPSQPQFLLRYAKRFGDEEATSMVLRTCERMAAGGIHDQLGGGFARYSVDAEWLVPHFEKMLYDNAQLAQLYLDAYQVSGDTKYSAVVRDILDYVLRDMTHPEGGFYSAEDADSEGQEGKFYCWTRSELSKLLSPEEFNVTVRYFGITERGNFTDHSHPQPLPNQNVLSIVDPKLDAADQALLASARKKMLGARSQRVRPHLDDKVLASWNGLMLGALARAAVVLGDETYRKAAAKNIEFVRTHLWEAKTKTLYHRWRDGEHDEVQLADAYAFYLSGLIEAYESTLDPRHLEFALAVAESMLARFYDSRNGGFWQSAASTPDLILRVKEDYDGAEPSGNSVAVLALLKLGKITETARFREAAEKTLRAFHQRLEQLPQAMPYMLQGLDFYVDEPKRAVVVGEWSTPETRALLGTLHSVFQPHRVVLGNVGPVDPFARNLPVVERPMVYLCTGTACQAPTNEPLRLREMMRQRL